MAQGLQCNVRTSEQEVECLKDDKHGAKDASNVSKKVQRAVNATLVDLFFSIQGKLDADISVLIRLRNRVVNDAAHSEELRLAFIVEELHTRCIISEVVVGEKVGDRLARTTTRESENPLDLKCRFDRVVNVVVVDEVLECAH